MRQHYIWTLRHWREHLAARRDEAGALYGERFCRMWEFYLVGADRADGAPDGATCTAGRASMRKRLTLSVTGLTAE